MVELDRADRDPSLVPEERFEHLKEKIATVRRQMRKLRRVGEELARTPDQQVSLTDPDARSMATSGRGTGIVGYNVQTAVDSEIHLIVAHDVVNKGHDREQLAPMAELAKKAMGQKHPEVLADRGYFDDEQIRKCEQADITPLVPKPLTSNALAEGRFDKRDFVYNRKRDEYRCPAGQRVIWRFTAVEGGLTIELSARGSP